jgi:hypothetical protein
MFSHNTRFVIILKYPLTLPSWFISRHRPKQEDAGTFTRTICWSDTTNNILTSKTLGLIYHRHHIRWSNIPPTLTAPIHHDNHPIPCPPKCSAPTPSPAPQESHTPTTQHQASVPHSPLHPSNPGTTPCSEIPR